MRKDCYDHEVDVILDAPIGLVAAVPFLSGTIPRYVLSTSMVNMID